MAAALSIVRTSNRKRTQVSYLVDEYYDTLDFELSKQDVEKDASVQSPKTESRDSSEQDGSVFPIKEGKPLRKKMKVTPKAKKTKAVVPFRFMDLPAELRMDILELCLVDPGSLTVISRTKGLRRIVQRGVISIDDGATYSGKTQPVYRSHWSHQPTITTPTYLGSNIQASFSPNLCAVSKQMREDASPVLYGQEIILEDNTALLVFLTAIGSFNRQLLAELTIKGWCVRKGAKANNFAAFAAMTDCVNLQSLFLDCSIGYYWSSPQKLARQIYKDTHFFLEAFGLANGGYDAAVDILKLSDFHFKEKSANTTVMTLSEKKYEEFEAALRSFLRR